MSALTWTTLPAFILPFHLRVSISNSQSKNKDPWIANEKPDAKHASSRKLTDPTLVPRLLDGLRRGIQKMQQDGTLPDESVFSSVKELLDESSINELCNEESVKPFSILLLTAVKRIVAKIYKAKGKTLDLTGRQPQERWGQQGDWNHFDKSNALNVALEYKSFTVAMDKALPWKGCWYLNHLKPQINERAIGMKLALHMASSSLDSFMGNIPTRFGVVIGGNIVSVAELVPYQERFEGTTLLASDFFRISDTLPHFDPVQHIDPPQASEIPGPCPLLALLVAMFCAPLDGFEIAEPSEEVLTREISVLESIAESPDNINVVDADAGQSQGDTDSEHIPSNSFSYNDQLSLAFYHPTLSPVSETLYRVHPPAPAFCNITNSSTTSANSALNQCEAAIRVPVNLSNLVGSGTDGRVWQGTLSDNASPIAVKSFRTKEAALKEAEFYENAPSTLSNLIPEYFGLYARRDQSWFVLVMEDVGKSLDKIGWNWRDVKTKLESDSWSRLCKSVREFHRAGFCHGDLEPRNVSIRQDGFRIFDFGYTTRHKCGGGKRCRELVKLSRS